MDGVDTQRPEGSGGGLSLSGSDWALPAEDGVHDELAELFIGPAHQAAHQSTPQPGDHPAVRSGSRVGPMPAERTKIEALLLGHLPVRASIWVRQYASRVAAGGEQGVGLVRLGRDGANVERHAAGHDAEGRVSWWIVRVDEVDQPALMNACGDTDHVRGCDGSPAVDRITVLTGADDAAVIACYRLLKSVAADLDRRLGDGEGPELAVSIAGADDARAEQALNRLREATQRFLGRDLVRGPSVPRAGRTDATTIGRWEGTTGVQELIETIRGGAAPTKTATKGAANAPSASRSEAPTTNAPPLPEPKMPAASRTPEPAPEPTPGPAADSMQQPRTTTRSEPVSVPNIASLIEGLVPIDLGCAKAPEVVFARDGAGGLHAITRFGREGLDAAMSAAGWARANATLLCRLEPELDPTLLADGCIVHVCADDARDLRALGDSDVQTHLLRRVPTATGDVWVCDPLN